jgi:hypothetical protein
MAKKFMPPPKSTKPLCIEILGGGEEDGLHLDTRTQDPVVLQQVQTIYRLTGGGEVGHTMTGMSIANLGRLLNGEHLTPYQFGGQPHYYTIVERVEDDRELLLQVQYTAGRTTPPKKDDGSLPEPGWANKAIQKFIELKLGSLDKYAIIEFWIAQEIQNGVATAIDRSAIERGYREGPLEAKCETIIANIRANRNLDATYNIDDELIYFRPAPKPQTENQNAN